MYLVILILSLLTIFAITISIVVIEIKKDLKSMKNHEAINSKIQIKFLEDEAINSAKQLKFMQNILKILERSHPEIYEQIQNEITNDNLIDNNQCKRSSKS